MDGKPYLPKPGLLLLNEPFSSPGFYRLHIQDDLNLQFVSDTFHHKIAMLYACASFVG
jgi:hypothetical protein